MATTKKAVAMPTDKPAKKTAAVKAQPAPPAPKKTKAEKPKFVPPKKPANGVDQLYETREKRLGLDRESTVLKETEGNLREWLIETIPKSDATGIAGKLARATVVTKVMPVPEDWSKIYKFIVDTYMDHVKKKTGQQDGVFALLNKALNTSTVSEMWEAGKTVPGVGKFNAKAISLSKV